MEKKIRNCTTRFYSGTRSKEIRFLFASNVNEIMLERNEKKWKKNDFLFQLADTGNSIKVLSLECSYIASNSSRCNIPWSSSVRSAVSCWRTSMNSQIKLAVANTEAQARKALQALKNPGQARLRLPLHLRPFLVDIFQYSDRSSLLSDSNS